MRHRRFHFHAALGSDPVHGASVTGADTETRGKDQLDSVVSEYAAEMFDAIKQGAPSEQYIDYDGLVRKTYARLGFPSDTVTEYPYPNGNCVMKRPQVTSLKGDGFGVTVRYTVVFRSDGTATPTKASKCR